MHEGCDEGRTVQCWSSSREDEEENMGAAHGEKRHKRQEVYIKEGARLRTLTVD